MAHFLFLPLFHAIKEETLTISLPFLSIFLLDPVQTEQPHLPKVELKAITFLKDRWLQGALVHIDWWLDMDWVEYF